jgi:hypothetical protein
VLPLQPFEALALLPPAGERGEESPLTAAAYLTTWAPILLVPWPAAAPDMHQPPLS